MQEPNDSEAQRRRARALCNLQTSSDDEMRSTHAELQLGEEGIDADDPAALREMLVALCNRDLGASKSELQQSEAAYKLLGSQLGSFAQQVYHTTGRLLMHQAAANGTGYGHNKDLPMFVNATHWPARPPYFRGTLGAGEPWDHLAEAFEADVPFLRKHCVDGDGKPRTDDEDLSVTRLFGLAAVAMRNLTDADALRIVLDIGDVHLLPQRMRAVHSTGATTCGAADAAPCAAQSSTSARTARGADAHAQAGGPESELFDRVHLNNVPDYTGFLAASTELLPRLKPHPAAMLTHNVMLAPHLYEHAAHYSYAHTLVVPGPVSRRVLSATSPWGTVWTHLDIAWQSADAGGLPASVDGTVSPAGMGVWLRALLAAIALPPARKYDLQVRWAFKFAVCSVCCHCCDSPVHDAACI